VAHKNLGGITGVLGELISPAAMAHATPPPPAALPTFMPKAHRSEKQSKCKPITIRSRLGRPPGRRAGVEKPKEKITVRIDAELIAAYRDWSWEARCQVGELVERALRQFLSRR
jgi:hypothetical protein